MPRPTASAAWQALQSHRQKITGTPLLELFAANPRRAQELTVEAAGLTLDFSKQPVTTETIRLLTALAQDAGLSQQISALLAGEPVNGSEQRAAWHTALRAGERAPDEVKAELAHIEQFSDAIRSGQWRGFAGDAITDVVNIGVGGSDLGPRTVCRALRGQAEGGPKVHFVANADHAELALLLRELNPASTLLIVASKSFTTAETRINAEAALAWLDAALDDVQLRARHVVTVSANPDAATSLGLPASNGFRIWDWVGGRYSLWSAMGLTIALSVGMPAFRELLAGAAAMDQHFSETDHASNMPVILALLGIWQRNFMGIGQQVILPYTHYLEDLPAHLQQLEMESNGKRVDRDGKVVDYATGTSIWGQVGTNAQHAFMQWLQQGTARLPVDFILPLSIPQQSAEQQRFQVASCLAQAAALMCGYKPAGLPPGETMQRQLPGNRPSSVLVMPRLDPFHLGALLALYEHKVFTQSVIWHINAFDQWGVEHGKQMAGSLIEELAGGKVGAHDASTQQLMALFLSQA